MRLRQLLIRATVVGACAACTQPNASYRASPADGGGRDLLAAERPDQDLAVVPPPPADAPADVAVQDGPGSPADVSPPADVFVPADGLPPDAMPDVAGPVAAGLVVHWRFDETTGTVAADSSPGGLNGTYEGNPLPATASDKAPTRFANVASRRFLAGVDHGVRLANPSARLRPTAGLTVSVWFRSTQTTRADLVAFGNDYFIRNNLSGEFQFVRRRTSGGTGQFFSATARLPAALDDRWHHIAGVTTTARIALWLDGMLVGQQSLSVPFLYSTGSTLLAGQSAAADVFYDGWLDDVRVYDRALSDDEIRGLARGEP